MARIRQENLATVGGGEEETMEPQIDEILILDRTVDPVTPLCTPLTYEARAFFS